MSETGMSCAGFEPSDAFIDWTESLLDGKATIGQHADLGRVLADDPEARKWFLEYVQLHAALTWGMDELGDIPVDAVSVSKSSSFFTFPSNLLHSTLGYFSSGWPVAYLIATVIFTTGMLIAAFTYVSQPGQVAKSSRPTAPLVLTPQVESVGRITGMVDCQWADREMTPVSYDTVPLGQRYALRSGLMEITYNAGAKVLLQGPATFEVDSGHGGYLSVGKLTARLEKRWTIGGQQSAISNLKSEVPNPQSLIPNSFVVRTPTVDVTDLGTEFAVEVQRTGAVEVHVIEGMVETARHGRASAKPVKDQIVAGQAMRFVSADAAPQRITGGLAASATGVLSAMAKARRSRPLLAGNVLATAYHQVGSSTGSQAKEDRRRAFLAVTDADPSGSFDTLAPSRSQTDFVGLWYDHAVRIDRVKVCLGRQSGDGGSWQRSPRVFILKNPVDTNQTPPEDDPVNWRELPVGMIFGRPFDARAEAGAGRCLEFVLTGYDERDRVGYGWAVGGVPGNGQAGCISVTKLFGFGAPVRTASDPAGNSIAREFLNLAVRSQRVGTVLADDFDGSSLDPVWTASLPSGEGWCPGTGATAVKYGVANSRLTVSHISGAKGSVLQNVWTLTRPVSDEGAGNPLVAAMDFPTAVETGTNAYRELKLLDSSGYLIAGSLVRYGPERSLRLFSGCDFNATGRGSGAPRDANNDDNLDCYVGAVGPGVARLVVVRDATNHYRFRLYAGPDYGSLSLVREAPLGRSSRTVMQFQLAFAGSGSPPMVVDGVSMLQAAPAAPEMAADVLFFK